MTATLAAGAARGPIGSNYLLTEDDARPHFAPPCDNFADGGAPAIVVIGAGYTGLSAALRLAELRQLSGVAARIVLLERRRVASGPSGKSAGHICGLQAQNDDVRRHCGVELGEQLISAAADASRLVRELIERYAIECDLRDGYVTIHADGQQSVIDNGLAFGIDSYPYALGLANAAASLGAEIYEDIEVLKLEREADGYLVTTERGSIRASHILASGAHRMAETIEVLAPLRQRTTELCVSTIITEKLPSDVLKAAMPIAAGRRLPFANDIADVAYGSVDLDNRLVFGAQATAWGKPDLRTIFGTLNTLLPSLLPAYRAATGTELGWRPLVEAERLCFTRDLLPNVGALDAHPNLLFVQALGGHGIALGTLLGASAGEKLWAMRTGDGALSGPFDMFSMVRHARLPAWQPLRRWTAGVGLILRRLGG